MLVSEGELPAQMEQSAIAIKSGACSAGGGAMWNPLWREAMDRARTGGEEVREGAGAWSQRSLDATVSTLDVPLSPEKNH